MTATTAPTAHARVRAPFTPAELLALARADLAAAAGRPEHLRYATAHMAALRAAGAVLAVRPRPAGACGPAVGLWSTVAAVAPELGDWAGLFRAAARRTVRVAAGADTLAPREVDALCADAARFVAVVARLIDPPIDLTRACAVCGPPGATGRECLRCFVAADHMFERGQDR